jgi:polysaccharide export outer membrane protein
MLTEEYRVGVGDVLDINIVGMPTRQSTLFTVLSGGSIEHPLLSRPIIAAGLTADEIAARLTSEIKVIRDARVNVRVRDYASHAVLVNGAVDSPGQKILRREAMPLYTVLAEALPRPEASVATIVHNGVPGQALTLGDQKAMSTLVMTGDAIRVSGSPTVSKQFVYVGGQVVSPGEKDYRNGMTLSQAILACGGATGEMAKSVRVSRRNANGFLVATEYDWRAIEQGKAPDPLLQAGDRIQLGAW